MATAALLRPDLVDLVAPLTADESLDSTWFYLQDYFKGG